MFLAQLLKLPGIHLVGVVDLNPAAASPTSIMSAGQPNVMPRAQSG